MSFVPSMQRVAEGSELRVITLGHPLVDAYLEFVGARGAVNTWLATAYDLKVFFEVIGGKEPAEVTSADVFAFLGHQRMPRHEKVVRIDDGEAGLSARTIARRLSSIAGLFEYLIVRGDAGVDRNPVPRGLAGRRAGQRGRGGVRLVRRPRTLPRVLSPIEVDRLLGALRTRRDRAIVLAMLLAGLRRCEVLGLRRADVNPGEQRLFVASGKGGRERVVPVSARFFEALGEYLEFECPPGVPTDACFVVLKGPRRGMPLSAAGLDEVIDGARARGGLARLTCHMLRHTCLTRLREQGMSLEALQAQAGHASIDSTRIYLHLANDWLVGEYLRAAEAIEAQIDPTETEGEAA
jgi:integrase/recombinase XerD